MCATVLEAPRRREECPHADTEILGAEGTTEFRRCSACGRVIIGQFGRFWILRPTE
jgi:hypothetical protein